MVFGHWKAFSLADLARLKWILLIAAFSVCALWETFAPRRKLTASAAKRWSNNAAVEFLLNSPLIWLLRANSVVVALWAQHSPYGLFNRTATPFWLRCILSVLLLDLLRYGQHRLLHRSALLWRVHRVHHSDPDFDWATSLLFHPGEQLLTQAIYLSAIVVLAPPVAAVVGLELLMIAQNIFVHANVRVPDVVDRQLRRVFITPDMHRIHHSAEFAEQNANFGDVFPWWDRCFGTYVDTPAAGHEQMKLGLPEFGAPGGLNFVLLLALPFRRRPQPPIPRR